MDMQQKQLKGYTRIDRDGKGNIVNVQVCVIGRDDNGKPIEVLLETQEWQVVDGLNQRVN